MSAITKALNVHIDFETYSELTPREVGSCRYAEHPSTEVICLAYGVDDEEPELWVPGDPPPADLFHLLKMNARVWAWNGEFEMSIWQKICVEQMGWRPVSFFQWRDTAALAATFGLPNALEDAAPAMSIPLRKDKRGKYLINKLSGPRKPSQANPETRWTPETAPEDFADFYEYCRQDVRVESAIHSALPYHTMPPKELETWRLTVEMNLRGWTVDLVSTDKMLAVMNAYKIEALKEFEDLTLGVFEKPTQIEKMLEWLKDVHDLDLPNMQAATVEKALLGDVTPGARRALEIRQELSRAATNKYKAQKTRVCDDGTVKNNLLYHGAGTGRDAGRGIQIQNYFRGAISPTEDGVETAVQVLHSGDPLEAIPLLYESVPKFAAKMTRSMLIASPGKVIYCGDYTSIENRVAAWYAGCEYALNIFRNGLDEYKMFCVTYYTVPYDGVLGWQRDHAKRAVLAFVFGSGWKRFQAICEQYGDPCTDEVAQATVDIYRKDLYPEVVSMWYALERAAMAAIESPGKRTTVRRPYATLSFKSERGFLFMRLASGREIAYRSPKILKRKTPWGELKDTITVMGKDVKLGWCRGNLIPGRIFENAVQGTARDIMMEGAKRVNAGGYDLIGRVHDELVNERDEGTGDLGEFLQLMCPKLDWFQGVPVEADGWKGQRYRK